MSTDIDHRITPALHPRNVQEVEGYDEDTAAILAPTETAFSTAYEGIRAVYGAREAADKNAAWTEEAKIIQVDEFARKHLARITRAFDTSRANLVKGIASIEAELSQPLESKAAASISAEIRAHAKALPMGDRHAFVGRAIQAGDHVTVSALLGAPSYLSGLEAQFQSIYTRQWHERANPEATKRLKAMQSAKAMIEERAGLIFAQLEKAVGGTSAKAKKLREAQTAAEKAFILRDSN